jgi:hypothetical protein
VPMANAITGGNAASCRKRLAACSTVPSPPRVTQKSGMSALQKHVRVLVQRMQLHRHMAQLGTARECEAARAHGATYIVRTVLGPRHMLPTLVFSPSGVLRKLGVVDLLFD